MASIPLTTEARELMGRPNRATSEVGWWAMALVCATEASLFAYFIASYFYLGAQNTQWPPAGIEPPKLLTPAIMTLVLLSSSAAMYWAERGVMEGKTEQLRRGMGAAIVLGAAFLVLQVFEYREKLRHFSPRTNAYTSTFFTITGFHGAHVAFGVLLLAYTALRAVRGHFSVGSHLGVKVTSLYWHFVDAVWLVIFSSLYLSPHLR